MAREFDYAVPEAWHQDQRGVKLDIGSMVRVPLHGRRVAAWVTELNPETPDTVTLKPLAKLSGIGPDADTIELARWAAHRWAGPVTSMLGTASPPKMTPLAITRPVGKQPPPSERFDRLFSRPLSVLRWPPAASLVELVSAAVRSGPAIVVVPQLAMARRLADGVRSNGGQLVVHPDQWALAAGGTSVIGSRSAVWARVEGLAAILVVDEHAEAMQEERSPTWHARDVAVERAKRLGIPCVLVSPHPSLDALRNVKVLAPSRQEERAGWPVIEIVDRRDDVPSQRGLFSGALTRFVKGDGRRLCVLNRTGRSQFMACRSCDELGSCSRCGAMVAETSDNQLACRSCGEVRPVVCSHCSSTSFKNLRLGVDRAREELEALVREPVAEVTAKGWDGDRRARVVIGTEAVLHQVNSATGVAFLDFDQELLAARFRAREQALAKLSAAARLVGGRDRGGRILVQTRQPDNIVLRAVLHAEPARVAANDAEMREALHFPPFGGLATVTGASAPEYAAAVGTHLGLHVVEASENRYVVQANDLSILTEALAATKRPSGRLRVEVDPPRA